MLEKISTGILIQEAHAWAIGNIKHIEQELQKQYDRLLPKTGYINYAYLSELGLCSALENIKLPSGFSIPYTGHVEVYSPYNFEQSIESTSHAFGLNENVVVCITTGQFFPIQYPNEFAQKGDRIKRYINLAPNLFTFNSQSGVAVLHGTQSEIYDKLHLHYIS